MLLVPTMKHFGIRYFDTATTSTHFPFLYISELLFSLADMLVPPWRWPLFLRLHIVPFSFLIASHPPKEDQQGISNTESAESAIRVTLLSPDQKNLGVCRSIRNLLPPLIPGMHTCRKSGDASTHLCAYTTPPDVASTSPRWHCSAFSKTAKEKVHLVWILCCVWGHI